MGIKNFDIGFGVVELILSWDRIIHTIVLDKPTAFFSHIDNPSDRSKVVKDIVEALIRVHRRNRPNKQDFWWTVFQNKLLAVGVIDDSFWLSPDWGPEIFFFLSFDLPIFFTLSGQLSELLVDVERVEWFWWFFVA